MLPHFRSPRKGQENPSMTVTDADPTARLAQQNRALPRYRGAGLRHVAMPLGGVGAGHVALGGDGGLRQWQLHNQVNHRGFVPDSFFAIRVDLDRAAASTSSALLQSREVAELPLDHTPLGQRRRHPGRPTPARRASSRESTRTDFEATYPFARVDYVDDELPVEIEPGGLYALRPARRVGERVAGGRLPFHACATRPRSTSRAPWRPRSRTRSAGTVSRRSPATATRSTAATPTACAARPTAPRW